MSKFSTTKKITTTTLSYLETETCGVRVNRNPLLRIIGGRESEPNSWPWQVYITDGRYACGASLISKQWLVTAAHCE